MLDIKYINSDQEYLEVNLTGKALLTTPQLNKSTAFTMHEREELKLLGKLPHCVETLEQQVIRTYEQYKRYNDKLNKNIFLNNTLDKNHVLFYKLVSEHLEEMLPVIYTPIVGTAVKKFSHEYRQPRGLYISYPDRDKITDIFKNRTNPEIDLVVVTDGEGVLGIGDQGIGGMDIPIAKLMVYTLCAGINPNRTLPVFLDVGTDNEELLNSPLYLGWRNKRIRGKEYTDFIKQFVDVVKQQSDHVFLHWEDFGNNNAVLNLESHQDHICSFNDDMQGTGAVALAALLAALQVKQESLAEQRIIIFGAGTAGLGIAEQIVDALVAQGMAKEEAYKKFWLLGRNGLLTTQSTAFTNLQQPYLRDHAESQSWQLDNHEKITLADVVRNTKPTLLIGSSTVSGAFTKEIISDMYQHCKQPIIFPLSNPTEKAEATPEDLINWTDGNALIATGSPFEDVDYNGVKYVIAQCNNALIFPGIGLGVLAAKAERLTKGMLWSACKALGQSAPIDKPSPAPLLPTLVNAKATSYNIALAVAKKAQKEGVAKQADNINYEKHIQQMMWEPRYIPYKLKKRSK